MKLLRMTSVVAMGASMLLGACGGSESGDSASAERSMSATVAQPDTTGSAMWAYLQEVDYQSNWQLWPDKGELYTGREPHGKLLTTYLNDVALRAVTTQAGSMPAGAVIVKENYMPDSTLAAVTVMYKRSGYNPDHNDWFFTKHLPSGELDQTPDGMPLEGRLAGCQNCHLGVRANDYIFTSSLGEGGQ